MRKTAAQQFWLDRPRLHARFERAWGFPVTVVCAPAGFGKSIAIALFLRHAGLRAVEHRVAPDETSLQAFVTGLGRTLGRVSPGADAAMTGIAQRMLSKETTLDDIADALADLVRGSGPLIVVDDLHHAAANADVVSLLHRLLSLTQGDVRWILASRSDADLPLATWLAYGLSDLPIGENELRFTEDEARAAALAQNGTADETEIERLRTLVDGWPAAFSIALRARVHAADVRDATAGARDIVYRFLAEQVLNALPPEARSFLIRSSMYPVLNATVAESLGGSALFLAELRRRVSFLIQIDGGDYRYHDLFREFLDHRLRMDGDDVYHRALCEAGAFYEERGEALLALRLFVRASDSQAIARVLQRDGIALFERGETETIESALSVLSGASRVVPAALGLRAMIDAARGNFEIAVASFAAAIESASGNLQLLLIHRYAVELVRHDRDCVAMLETALTREMPETLRVSMLGTFATALVRADRIEGAYDAIAQALELVERLGDDDLRARIYQQAAFVHQFSSAREQARTYATLAAELAEHRGLHEVAARAYSVLYGIVYDDGDSIGSLEILRKLDECAKRGASQQARTFGTIATYGIYTERGDEEGLARLDRALETSRTILPRARAEALLPAQALRAAWGGAFDRAYRLLASATLPSASDRRALRAAEMALCAFAAGLTSEGDAAENEAVSALSAADAGSERAIRARALLALAEMLRGHITAASRHIAEAERALPSRDGRSRALVTVVRLMHRSQLGHDESEAIAASLKRLDAEHFGGIARLIQALPSQANGSEAGYSALTATERAVLSLLASGASSKTIAGRIGRSPQTIDTHVRSICRKLRCSGRREAVALASRSGWV